MCWACAFEHVTIILSPRHVEYACVNTWLRCALLNWLCVLLRDVWLCMHGFMNRVIECLDLNAAVCGCLFGLLFVYFTTGVCAILPHQILLYHMILTANIFISALM